MISPEEHTEIRRLFYAEHHTINAIATAQCLHHDTVRRAIGTSSFNARAAMIRQGVVDPYVWLIDSTVESVPRVRATRMTEILKSRGYPGSVDAVRRYLRQLRGSRKEDAALRLSMLPGEQAQCDWGHFGTIQVGNAKRKLSCFVMVLSYSRYIYAAFTFDQTLESFLRHHVLAFRSFGGVPYEILYDCLKACVLERVGDAVRFNPALLELSGHYHFKAKACKPRMPRHKGRVERAIGYLRTSFFPARKFRDMDDANRQIESWLKDIANVRKWPQDRSRHVNEALVEDRQRLMALPQHDADCWHVRPIRSDKTAFVRFDLNDYSIPPELCRKPLTLMASDVSIRLLDGGEIVAEHLRCYEKGKQIEVSAHREALLARQKEGLPQRRRESLIARIPESQRLLEMLADRGESLVGHLRRLYDLVAEYGVTLVAAAIAEAVKRQTPRAESVAHLLQHQKRNILPSIAVELPDHPGVRDLVIRHHPLDQYDAHPAQPPKKEGDKQ